MRIEKFDISKGINLYKRAKKLIPGGTQLLSKRPEMFLPGGWPAYYRKCKGAEVWDLNGNKFIDMSINGVGACILGYADKDVDNAVKRAIAAGSMCTLNCPEEIELAELLCELHPWAQMVRYAKCGGEAMSIAVRIARAATGREKIAFCGYHGWHDWYLSANLADDKNLDGQLLPGLEPRGIPRSLKGTSIPFNYNQPETLDKIIAEENGKLAAIVMEPVRSKEPDSGFLQHIRDVSKKIGTVLIFDEVTSGWRMNTGGIHLLYGVNPDMAVFAKGMSNGYPMAAIIGRRKIMEAAQSTFISSTYWTEKIGPAAALATIRKHKKYGVSSHLIHIGTLVQQGWRNLAKKYGLNINIKGIPPLSHWEFENKDGQLLHTIITKEMLQAGFITSKSFYSTYALNEKHIKNYLDALDNIIEELIPHIHNKTLNTVYQGAIAHTGFTRLS